jgi:hypothetical protein
MIAPRETRSRVFVFRLAARVAAVNGSVNAMATTVISGPPNDPLDEFRSQALPAWERRGDYGDIIYEVAEGIARITINRPEVRNAFRPQTLFELSRAFEQARDDLTVGVVVLTGAGYDAFCSGGDQRIRGR